MVRGIVIGLFFLGIFEAIAESKAVKFCENGHSEFVICYEPSLGALAEELQGYLSRATGFSFETSVTGEGVGLKRLSLVVEGDQASWRKAGREGGFAHDFRDPKDLRIVAGAVEDVSIGVYDFLERYVGVRWIMPGELGEIVPKRKDIEFASGLRYDVPAFFSRNFPAELTPDGYVWARRMRGVSRISFHHGLGKMFLGQVRGDVAPLISGERYIPSKGLTGWQPCLTSFESVEIATVAGREALGRSSLNSFSLGINDSNLQRSSGFCECSSCIELDGKDSRNFLGKRHRSPSYYAFCNRVTEQLAREGGAEFTVGCLAYSEVAQAPDFNLEEQIVPFLTYDRHKWVDPVIETEGRGVTEEWAARASGGIGFYDYMYGTALYAFPRMYLEQMARNYRFATRVGVKAHYAEYAGWADGPKPYIAQRLQWDPYLDVGTMLDEWCRLCVGERAGPHLRRYYEIWEGFWTSKALKESTWFHRGRQWLDFTDMGYFDVLDPMIVEETSDLMEKVVALADSERARSRARLLQEAQEFGRSSYDGWIFWREGYEDPDAMELLRDLLSGRLAWATDRMKRPGVVCHRYVRDHPGLNGVGWAYPSRGGEGALLISDDFSDENGSGRATWKFGGDGVVEFEGGRLRIAKVMLGRVFWDSPLEAGDYDFSLRLDTGTTHPEANRLRLGYEVVESGDVSGGTFSKIVATPGGIARSGRHTVQGSFSIPSGLQLEAGQKIRLFLAVDCGRLGEISLDEFSLRRSSAPSSN